MTGLELERLVEKQQSEATLIFSKLQEKARHLVQFYVQVYIHFFPFFFKAQVTSIQSIHL